MRLPERHRRHGGFLPQHRDARQLHELGIAPTDAQIDEMARRCLEACGSALGSAKKLDLDDMIAIYRAANH